MLNLQLNQYTLVLFPLLFVAIANQFYVGEMPEPLSKSQNPKRDNFFVLFLFILHFVILIPYHSYVLAHPMRTPENRALYGLFVYGMPMLVVAFYVVMKQDGWTWQDLGFRSKMQNKATMIIPTIFLVIQTAVGALMGLPRPVSVWILLLAILMAPMFEEIIHRGIIQNKLETTIGQTKAWVLSGFLFGLIHLPTRIINYAKWGFTSLTDIELYLSILTTSFWGLVAGGVYMKTRNIWYPIFFHYVNNSMLDLLAVLLNL
jgi:membrane protease YdiL (CAAX protease family)